MTERSTFELARQGDPDAIAELISRSLKSKSINVKVSRNNDHLKILLESSQPLPKDSLINFIKNGINKLEIANIRTLHIWGLKFGEKKPSWYQVINLFPAETLQEDQFIENEPESISIPQDVKTPSTPKRGGCLDGLTLIFSSIFGLFIGIFLSGIFGEDASPALRVILGVFGLFLPTIIVLFLRRNYHWGKIRLLILSASVIALIGSTAYLRQTIQYQSNYERNIDASIANESMQADQSTNQSSSMSHKATQLRMGMTYREVVALLGRMPDTVVNDQIRKELGEPTQGHSLITFEWRNDDSNCQPVSVDFNSSSMTTTGWNEGRVCTGSSIFNEPFGKSCSGTTLCQLR